MPVRKSAMSWHRGSAHWLVSRLAYIVQLPPHTTGSMHNHLTHLYVPAGRSDRQDDGVKAGGSGSMVASFLLRTASAGNPSISSQPLRVSPSLVPWSMYAIYTVSPLKLHFADTTRKKITTGW
ncbi:hypothetical protein DL89DRAFT_4962 [Linderina pennispora]|uniref:Uncharacterized protein n=1 Tax=Linderina pennispora TaxID=61395 RepID=A0A1Y1WKX7_9FUNG|nr:uncharacterized protein DL89DRAFT_4962 [Linderina pennispora]ORX73856.1 hypothetical protein DL89DRAFT_4962 [Linderina pennispora]